MKIISWNANGKFEKNFPAILKENADIYVIQECTNPFISDSKDYTELGSEYYWVDWVGDDKYPDYGLGIFAKNDVNIKLWDLDDKGLRYFIPVTVNEDFNLLGVWTNPNMEGNKSIYYPEEITKYYDAHKDSGFFNKDMIICGDFNCDVNLTDKRHEKNVLEMIDRLSEKKLVDVYHDLKGEEQGQESKPTFFWRYNLNNPYHIDRVFAAHGRVKDLKIGCADEWIKLSDHMPLIFEIDSREEIEFEYEYYLQQITNNHLKYLFELEFLAAEFQLPGLGDNGLKSDETIKSLKVDGLAYDKKTKSFVVLEYKKKLDPEVLKQGKKYYKNFEEKFDHYNEKVKTSYTEQIERLHEQIKTLDEIDDDFDLSISKVIIISPEFSDEDIKRSKTPDYPFELYTVELYKISKKLAHVLYKKIDQTYEKELYVSAEDLKITRCSLLANKKDNVKGLYKDFENKLFEQFKDDLDMRYIVDGVSIKAQEEYICLVNVKNSIKIHFYIEKNEEWDKDANDGKIRDISGISTGGGSVNYELTLNQDNMEYAIELINRVYDKKMK